MASLRLSRRALLDIQEIEAYSVEKWGAKVAAEYLKSIEGAEFVAGGSLFTQSEAGNLSVPLFSQGSSAFSRVCHF